MSTERPERDEDGNRPAWGSRGHRIQLIQSYLIPFLDDTGWERRYEPDSGVVDESAAILAEEYYDMAVPAVWGCTVLLVLLFVVDYLVFLDGAIYGLSISIWASIFMVFPSLKGRFIIATAVQGEPTEAISRLQAEEVVTANTGFVFLALGFVFQVVSNQFLTSEELVQTNLIGNEPQSWLTAVLLILTFFITSKTMAKLRDSRLSARKSYSERD